MKLRKVLDNNPYLVSDTHFNHTKIIDYCNRPKDWQSTFINYWNDTVKPDENVLHLGDFALGNKYAALDIINKLNGNIYLLPGNHDYDKINFYLKYSKIIIINSDIIAFDNLILSHFPKYSEDYLLKYNKYNIHGHVHTNERKTAGTRHINISIEVMDYKLVHLSELPWERKKHYA